MILVHLIKNRGFISRLIQWQTRSPYSHAAVQIGNFVWESVGSGVRQKHMEVFHYYYQGIPMDTFEFRPPGIVDETNAARWLNKQVGKPYDLRMIVRFLTHQQEHRKSRGKWFCSELAFAALGKAGWPALVRVEPWAVSPAQLSYSPYLVAVKRETKKG